MKIKKEFSYPKSFYILCTAIFIFALVSFILPIKKYLNYYSNYYSVGVEGVEGVEGLTNQNKIGIVSMMMHPKNIDTWLQTHRDLGISRFYIRLEDTPSLVPFFSSQNDVHLILGDPSGVNEYEEKQNRQKKWVDDALILAREEGIDWLIQIDSDELLEGDLEEIRQFPQLVHTFWMENHEALYENIPKKEDNCFRSKKMVSCSSPDPSGKTCSSYANGKGGGRTTINVFSRGAHRFMSSLPNSERKLNNLIVKHFESCDFDLYKEKYLQLSQSDRNMNIPFPYYNDSILAAKEGGEEALKKVYMKYRVD